MATDFNRVIYHAVEDHIIAKVGKENYAKLDKYARRQFMDDTMKKFSKALVTIVATVAEQQVKAQEAVEKQVKAQALEESLKGVQPETPPCGGDVRPSVDENQFAPPAPPSPSEQPA